MRVCFPDQMKCLMFFEALSDDEVPDEATKAPVEVDASVAGVGAALDADDFVVAPDFEALLRVCAPFRYLRRSARRSDASG